MAEFAVAKSVAGAKLTGQSVNPISVGFNAIKAEIAQHEGKEDDPEKGLGEEEKEVSPWETWKWRVLLFTGAGLGAAFIGVDTTRKDKSLTVMYGVFWCLWAAVAMGLNWNFAVMLALYRSADKIEKTYRDIKGGVDTLEANNKTYSEQNGKLQASVVKLEQTQEQISRAGKLLEGEVADLKVIQQKVTAMNEKTLKTIDKREDIARRQRKIVAMQKEEELDYQRDEILNRIRAYFDDAAGENGTIEKKEYEQLAKLIRRIPVLRDSGFEMLRFEDYSDEYDDRASVLEKFEMTSKLRPLLTDHFDKQKDRIGEELKKTDAEAKGQFRELKAQVRGEAKRRTSRGAAQEVKTASL